MEIVDVFVPLDDGGAGAGDRALAARIEQALGWASGDAGAWRVLRRSLDARKNHPIGHRLRVEVARRGEALAARRVDESARAAAAGLRWPMGRTPPAVVVVGAGPAGTWAALRLA